jgi:hypothetical protein
MKWLNRTPARPLPFFCLCTAEAEYRKAMRHLKLKNPPLWISKGANATTHHLTNTEGKTCCVVCIEVTDESKGQVYGLLVHEAVHIWQEYCDDIGEKNPSSEFEAYTIQAISQALMFSFDAKTLDRKAK